MKKKSLILLLISSVLLLGGCEFSGFKNVDVNTNNNTNNNDDSGDSGSNNNNNTNVTLPESPSNDGNTSSNNNNNNSSSNNNTPGNTNSNQSNFIAPDFSSHPIREKKEDVTFDDFFNLHNKVNISIQIDEDELQKIEQDYIDYTRERSGKPEYYHVAKQVDISLTNGDNTFTWTFDNVGIRQKGGVYSRSDVYYYGSINNQVHYKLSFDETFLKAEDGYSQEDIDKYGNKNYKDREFLGMSGLDIKWNRNGDLTHLREVYASKVYQAAGIVSQHVGLSTFSLTCGEQTANFGLCNVFEQASKSLIKRSLSNGQSYVGMGTWKEEKAGKYGLEGENYGDMYKATYGGNPSYGGGPDFTTASSSSVGLKTDLRGINYPIYERKTAKSKTTYEDTMFKNMIEKINDGDYDDIASVVDLNYLAKEEAVAFYVGNCDSFRYNYNNYEFYIRRTDGKMVLIPIDNDRAFGTGNTWESGLDFVNTSSLSPFSNQTISGSNRNPLIQKTLLANGNNQFKTLFKQYLQEFKSTNWVKNETFLGYYNVLRNTYSGLAEFALSNGANVTFESYIAKKITAVNNIDNNQQNNNNNNNPSYSVRDKDHLYIVGTFNNWGNYDESELNQYKLNQVGNSDVYSVTINVGTQLNDETNEGYAKIKFNNGYANYNVNNYSVNDGYLTEGGSSYRIYGVNQYDNIKADVNVVTGQVIITINP